MSPHGSPLHDPMEVARRLALDFGIAALARRMGMNERVLAHQLNPEQEGHKLGLATALAMTEIANDNAILQAWAAERGLLCVPMPRGEGTEEELLDECLALDSAHGNFGQLLMTARTDGVIDATEFRAIAGVLRKMMQQAAEIERDLAARVRVIPTGAAVCSR